MKNIPGKKSWITSITQNTPLFTIYKGGYPPLEREGGGYISIR